jgi:hypothetical protein
LGKRFGKEEEKKAPGFTPLVVVFPRPSYSRSSIMEQVLSIKENRFRRLPQTLFLYLNLLLWYTMVF